MLIVENLEKEERVIDDKNVQDGVKFEVDSLEINDCSIDFEAD